MTGWSGQVSPAGGLPQSSVGPVATSLPIALLHPHPVSPHESQSAPSGAFFHLPCPRLVLVLRAPVSGASLWAQQTSDHRPHPPVSSSAHS